MGQLSCEAVSYLQVLLSVYYSLLLNTQTPADLGSIATLRNGSSYDFIIVGGGSAGCVLARRLSEIRNWNIALFEAGVEEPAVADIPAFGNNLKLSILDWQYWTQPQSNACGGQPCQWPRGKVLGGGSTINDMIYNRGNKYDYDGWANLGNDGWNYDNALKYFKKSENNLDPDIAADTKYHSIGGPLPVGRFPYTDENVPLIIRGYQDDGFKLVDFNARQVLGVAHLQATQFYGTRGSTNRAFLEPIRRQRPNLKVFTQTRIVKILIDPNSKTAYGVEYVGENNRSITGQVFARKEVLLSGGTINSAQLLLLSGIGPQETLEQLNITVIQNLSVGYNLQDHVGASAVSYFVKNSTRPNAIDIVADQVTYSSVRRGPWSGIGSISVTSYANSRYANKSIDYPDIQFTTIPSLSEVRDLKCEVNFTIPWCYYNRVTFMPLVLRPKSMGYLTINSTDPFTYPLLYANYFDNPQDMNVLIDGLNIVVKLADTKTFKDNGFILDKTAPVQCADLEYGTNEYWTCVGQITTHSNFHIVGTCKMGPSTDPEAVVDPQLNVYGIKNLRVIDASIMPKVTSGNTNAPTIMIAEKGADLVKQSYGIAVTI